MKKILSPFFVLGICTAAGVWILAEATIALTEECWGNFIDEWEYQYEKISHH